MDPIEYSMQSGRVHHVSETGQKEGVKKGFKLETESVYRLKNAVFQKTGLLPTFGEITHEGKVYHVNKKSFEKWKRTITGPDFAQHFPFKKQLELIAKFIEIKNQPMPAGQSKQVLWIEDSDGILHEVKKIRTDRSPENPQIKFKSWEIGSELARGGLGKVAFLHHKTTSRVFKEPLIPAQFAQDEKIEKQARAFMNEDLEKEFKSRQRFPNNAVGIQLPFKGFIPGTETTPARLIMKKYDGSLLDFIQPSNDPEKRPPVLSGADKKKAIGQLLEGMATIHEAGCKHGDVKIDNIFYLNPSEKNEERRYDLSDFGTVSPSKRPADFMKDIGGLRKAFIQILQTEPKADPDKSLREQLNDGSVTLKMSGIPESEKNELIDLIDTMRSGSTPPQHLAKELLDRFKNI